MTTPEHRQSAIIYDFAARARAAMEARGQVGKMAELDRQQFPVVDFGSGWYHEAAIKDADRTRKQ